MRIFKLKKFEMDDTQLVEKYQQAIQNPKILRDLTMHN